MENNAFEETPTIVVFAGTHYGNDPSFQYIAYKTGNLIAQAGFNLANGAGLGLMEEVSKGAKDEGGRVFGVGLRGQAHNQYLDVYHERVGIHSRQSYLFSRGDAFITLPGGMGTLYETIETAELKKLSEVELEPLIIINHQGFFDNFKIQLENMRGNGFIVHALDRYIEFVEKPEQAITKIKKFYKLD